MNPLFVGIDVSSKNNVVCLMRPDGTQFSTFSVQNNLGGAKILLERIVSALDKLQLNEVKIGLEATSIYGDNLVYAFREDGKPERYQRKIHVLNPKQVRKFKESYPDLPKNDFMLFCFPDLRQHQPKTSFLCSFSLLYRKAATLFFDYNKIFNGLQAFSEYYAFFQSPGPWASAAHLYVRSPGVAQLAGQAV